MTSRKATMTTRFDDQKGRSPDDTDNRITTPNTHNAISLYADDKAAIGKAGDDKTIEFEEIESDGERSVSGGRFDACNAVWKEVINPHVDNYLDKIIRWLNCHAAAWKALHNDDFEAFADTIAVNWSDAQQHLIPSLQKQNTTGQRWVTSLIQKALDVAWDRWQQRNEMHNHTLHPWRTVEGIESRGNYIFFDKRLVAILQERIYHADEPWLQQRDCPSTIHTTPTLSAHQGTPGDT
jgi:hypothetical protein